jgi:anaerobic ribonucleoside-triphosphate reductase activating protein
MLRICGVVRESIVDGPGLRFVVFTQGCPHHCKGCHNPQSHDIGGGYLCSEEKIIEEFKKNPLLKGITFSGGEPMLQPAQLIPIAKAVAEMGKDIIIYSGYTYEELTEMGKTQPDILKLLEMSDILVDGRYEEAERDLTLRFKGSRNQRIIDLKKTRKENKIVLADI